MSLQVLVNTIFKTEGVCRPYRCLKIKTEKQGLLGFSLEWNFRGKPQVPWTISSKGFKKNLIKFI